MSARVTEIHRGSRLFETVDFEDLDPARFIHLNMNTKLTKVADGKRVRKKKKKDSFSKMLRFHLLFMHFLTFTILSSCFTATAQQGHSNINIGSSLSPNGNSSWLSPSGIYAFGFYQQSNGSSYFVGVFLAGIPEKNVVWTANRDNPPVSSNATLFFNSDF